VNDLFEPVTQWASTRPDIRDLLVVGSQARGDGGPIPTSILSCFRHSQLNSSRTGDWTRIFGVVERDAIEDWGELTSVRVRIRTVRQRSSESSASSASTGETTLEVLRGGYRVLLDRDGLFDRCLTRT
jgi:hypothetical protein